MFCIYFNSNCFERLPYFHFGDISDIDDPGFLPHSSTAEQSSRNLFTSSEILSVRHSFLTTFDIAIILNAMNL